MANSYLSKDFGSAGNQKTMTFSWWYKSSGVSTGGQNQCVAISGQQQSYPTHSIRIDQNDRLYIRSGIAAGSSNDITVVTARRFRDKSSWYHFLVAIDTTQATDTNRVKVYVNGVQQTVFDTAVYSSQNYDSQFNRGHEVENIGRFNNANTYDGLTTYTDGHFAHYHFVDGTALTPSTFGSTDSTTGEWKPNLSPTISSYGTHGFFLKFENASALGTDSSGNSKTWSVNGNVKQSASTPSNLFNTLNPNEAYITNLITAIKYAGTGWEDANTSADGIKGITGTLGMASGKWYYEMKYISPAMYTEFGIAKANTLASSKLILDTQRAPWYQGNEGDGFGFRVGSTATVIMRGDNTEVQWTTNGSTNIASATNGQICMCAFDLDAGKIWWGINGTWNTVPGSTTSTSSSQIASGSNAHKTWTPTGAFYRTGHSEYNRFGNASEQLLNFGEGRFGTTAVASGNADSAGEGVFEYAPPTNFLAICTKNIKNTG